ncbi:hypothetical protein HID58_008410 [Brassica napus]|uniref:Uncharacterized protein n=1 Tax=Brassica napus TaxID=3708 RepID=A0ABQ8DPX8_BRANA|nr:hypothetical protein HID58_008410 [Brassica napus]
MTTRVKPQDKFNQVSPKWLQAGIDGNGWLPPRSSVWRRTPTNKLKLPQRSFWLLIRPRDTKDTAEISSHTKASNWSLGGTEVLGGAPHNHPSLRSERRSSTKPLNQHNRETRLEGNTRQEKRRSRRVTVSGESQISDLTQIRAQTVTTSRSKGSRVNFNSSHLASVPERSKDALLSVRSDGEAPSNPEQPNREERRGGDNKGERRYQKRENQETRGDRIYGPATARKLRRWRARGRES